MKFAVALLTGAAVLAVVGCSTISANYDYDPNADFTSLRTFNWFPFPENAREHELILKRVKTEVNAQLGSRGLNKSDNPDFLIAVHGGKQAKVDIVDWGYSYGRYRGYGPRMGTQRIDVYEYEEGSLILDFVDTGTKELVWRGSATGVLLPNPSPAERGKRIREAVTKILENYPPKP